MVGPPGCGKSTLFEGLSLIYTAGAKPERENRFPLSSILEADVLLWQEFSWAQKMCAFEDLLQVTAGEQLAIRVPCAKPVQHRNTAPMFYTAWVPISISCSDVRKMTCLDQAMAERFRTRMWSQGFATRGQFAEVSTARMLLC